MLSASSQQEVTMIQRVKNIRFLSAFIPAFLCFVGTAGIAQTFRGGIAGSVTDTSGGAISGAQVRAVNNDTGLVRELTTGAGGDFTIEDLPVGNYTVTVAHPGFQTVRAENVRVEVGAMSSLPVKLDVARQTTTIEVVSAPVAIETESTALNAVMPDRAVQNVPLNGRDFTQLIKLAPGVNGAGSLNGGRIDQTNWQIDGADNNDLWHNSVSVNQGGVTGLAGTLLPVDAIDQFSVQSSGNAESGRNGAGSINLVIKSGTNTLHGTLYYFNRNDALAAKTPFAPAGSPTPKLKNNQFGGSLGGPIVKNKLFYFLTYERQKYIVGNQNGALEPSVGWVTLAQAVLNRYGVPVNPVSLNVLSFWPARGRTGPATNPNFFSSDNSESHSDNGIGKIDYNLNEKNSIAFRYFVGTGNQTAPVNPGMQGFREYYQVAPSRMHNFSLVYNTVVTPTLVNQLLAGVNYFKQVFNDADTSFNPVAAGLNTGVTNPSLLGAPDILIGSFDEIGLTPPLGRIDTTGHLTETLSYTAGVHQLRFGGEYRRSRGDIFYNRNGRGAFTFDGSQGPWSNDPTVSGNVKSLADYLAGFVQSSSITIGDQQRIYTANDVNWFAEDSWKATPKLTLNFGVRWDYFGPFLDPTDRISTFIPSKGGIVYQGHGIGPIYPRRFGNVAPRFGFAYSPGAKWVIRGNYGIFYDRPLLKAFGDNNPPNRGATGVLANPGSIAPVYSVTRSNYTIVPNQLIFGSASIPPPPYGVFSVSQDFRNAYNQNFGLNLQYQLSNSTVFQVGYVGSLGRRLLMIRDINQPPPSPLGASATRAVQNTLRPYYALFPQYATINQIESIGNSEYNALQASLRTNAWHGLTSQLSYTYGHSIDEGSAIRSRNPTNSYNLAFDRGNSDFDVRHTFTGYIVYTLPQFSRGPRLLVQGWQLNSVLTFFTGLPFTAYSGLNVSGTFEGRDRVNLIDDPYKGGSEKIVTNPDGTKYVQYLNPAAFAQPAPATFGDLARNALFGPAFADVDFAVVKNTRITERVNIQLRAEMFNLFNRTNLPIPGSGGAAATSPPGTKLNSSSFGRIFDTVGDFNGVTGIGAGEPFNIQLSLKVIF
ncbi:MAG: TonB-dependent receptor [Acidobacteriaceae bacterium]|nr:TonB-dependent receptor [Acidobacteriaceae bacterium]